MGIVGVGGTGRGGVKSNEPAKTTSGESALLGYTPCDCWARPRMTQLCRALTLCKFCYLICPRLYPPLRVRRLVMIEKMPCKVTLHQSEGSPTLTQTPENEGWGIKEDQIPS